MSDIMSPDDFLEHHGVKGMKWGVRKARDASATPKTTSKDIIEARLRTREQKRGINEQRRKLNATASGSKAQRTEAKKLANMQMEFLRNPDRATAERMTRGEKIGLTILAVGIPGYGTAGALGAVGGQTIRRKRAEASVRRANE